MPRRETILTRNDLDIEDIRGSGPGGQHRNKSYTGVRIRHRDSGAVGEATDSRSHETNRGAAFRRMIDTPEFQVWLELRTKPHLLRVETFKAGQWIPMR